jgi:hypothetical protein
MLRLADRLFYIAIVLAVGGCSLCAEPPPKAYFSWSSPSRNPAFDAHPVQVSICSSDSLGSEMTPVLVTMASRSATAWTVDASQVSVCSDTCSGQADAWLSVPPAEAARMAPVSFDDALGDIITQGGVFAAYSAGIGAAGGAFAANAKGEDVSNGFSLGAAYGAVIGGVAGMIYEYLRLTYAHESKDAGAANEKMMFLALQSRSILYTGYTSIGYVYFAKNLHGRSQGPFKINIPFVRGDPSKDWAPPNNFSFPQHTDKDGKNPVAPGPERFKEIDVSPVVCECQIPLHRCDVRSVTKPECKQIKPTASKSEFSIDEGICNSEFGSDFPSNPASGQVQNSPTQSVWRRNTLF